MPLGLTEIPEKYDVQAAEEEQQERTVFCETHGKKCRFVPPGAKCACCGKRVCLCNYVL